MPHEYRRSDRVADQIQRELATLIQQNIKDPRVGMVTITAVDVSREFEYARVFFTVLGNDQQKQSTLKGLKSAAGYLRRELARRIKLRSTPELQFVYDTTMENAQRITSLISQAIATDNANRETNRNDDQNGNSDPGKDRMFGDISSLGDIDDPESDKHAGKQD